jgi:hypothetical protein
VTLRRSPLLAAAVVSGKPLLPVTLTGSIGLQETSWVLSEHCASANPEQGLDATAPTRTHLCTEDQIVASRADGTHRVSCRCSHRCIGRWAHAGLGMATLAPGHGLLHAQWSPSMHACLYFQVEIRGPQPARAIAFGPCGGWIVGGSERLVERTALLSA